MKKIITLLCLLLGNFFTGKGQDQLNTRLNTISVELGKNGLIYNLYYDRKLATTAVGFRLGVGSNFAQYLAARSVGIGAYYLLGKNKHFFESGIDLQYLSIEEVSDDQKGFSLVYPDYSTSGIAPFLNVGYRYCGNAGIFRVGLSPGIIDQQFVPGGYLAYGIRF